MPDAPIVAAAEAARRAHGDGDELAPWASLPRAERDRWLRVADAVIGTWVVIRHRIGDPT